MYLYSLYRVSQLKRNTFQWFIVIRLEGKKNYVHVYDMVRYSNSF